MLCCLLGQEVLPIHLQLSGEVRGYAFLSNIPDTNAFLLAVEHYESSQKAQGCGMLSTQVNLSFLPYKCLILWGVVISVTCANAYQGARVFSCIG